jgi:hypothetical protein
LVELKQIARVFPLVSCVWLAAKIPVTATLPGYEAGFVSTNQKLKMTEGTSVTLNTRSRNCDP